MTVKPLWWMLGGIGALIVLVVTLWAGALLGAWIVFSG